MFPEEMQNEIRKYASEIIQWRLTMDWKKTACVL
jgi:hypothetical protein